MQEIGLVSSCKDKKKKNILSFYRNWYFADGKSNDFNFVKRKQFIRSKMKRTISLKDSYLHLLLLIKKPHLRLNEHRGITYLII